MTPSGDVIHVRTQRPGAPAEATPRWLAWLAENDRFAYDDRLGGSFTARKEQRRVGAFWYAFANINGKTIKRYLGKTEQLDSRRLAAVGREFQTIRHAAKETS